MLNLFFILYFLDTDLKHNFNQLTLCLFRIVVIHIFMAVFNMIY